MEHQEYLNRIHAEILTVMDEVHRICTENKLRYFLTGGSLLGGIRHKGFIPWDDDLDIVMPRDDFNKFMELTKHSTGKFKLLYGTGYQYYPLYFMKYENTDTVFYEGKEWVKGKKPGIFVDIFPIDYSKGNLRVLNIQKRIICRLSDIISKKSGQSAELPNFGARALYKLLPMRLLKNIRYAVAQLSVTNEAPYFANFGSQYNIEKQHFPIEKFGKGKLIPFEDRMYYAPIDPDFVLNRIFGSKYMQIPPEEKRRTHYPKMVQFSNREVVVFEEPKHKVTVQEQL